MIQEIPKSKSGLPILSSQQIDLIAQECARSFFPEMFEKPQPIDPAEFIEQALGFDLDYLYLSNCQLFLGLTCFKNIAIPVFNMEEFTAQKADIRAGAVIIDRGMYEEAYRSGYEGRLRFTEAHEAGHCLLHSDFFMNFANQTKVGENNFVIGACSAANESDLAEEQADLFASCFLIPHEALHTLFEDFKAWDWPDRDKLLLVRETFNVSWPTAFYRLKGLGYLLSHSRRFRWEEFAEY